jgi:hypothetical protein
MTIELTKLALTVVLGVVEIVLSAHKNHRTAIGGFRAAR